MQCRKILIAVRIIVLLVGSVSAGILTYCTRAYVVSSELKAKIDEVVQPLIDSGERVSIAVGVIVKDATQTFGYGETVLDSGNEPDGDTIFEIASVTKTFTTLLLASMVENGTLNLEDPIENFLPSSVKVPSFGNVKITLVDLATHTSGLPRMPTNFNPKDPMNPYADYTEKSLYEFLSGYLLPREPSKVYEYSNVGLGLLGHILELKTGINYETLVLDRICNTLSMNNTQIHLFPEQKQHLAQGYMHHPASRPFPIPNWDFDVLAPCGALRSTVNDLLKFLSANLGLTETNLASAIELTHAACRETHDLFLSYPLKICLGWHKLDFEGLEVIWHNGASYGYHSFTGFIKEAGIGAVILSNTYVEASTSIERAGLQILRILRDQTLVASFSHSPITPWVNESIAFNASTSYSQKRNITSYEWNFGDHNITTVTEPIINHTYALPGKYAVSLKVTDNNTLWDTARKTITVYHMTDLNKDGAVNIQDIFVVAQAFGSRYNETDGMYWHDPPCKHCPHTKYVDIIVDKWINIADLYKVAKDFGKTT